MPSLPIERGRPGPGLLAHVLVSKYCDQLPLYRQSEIYARDGLDLPRGLLAGWVGKSAELADLYVWLEATLRRISGKSDLAKVIRCSRRSETDPVAG